MIIIPRLRLGYQNVPKIATTSLFEWLYLAHGSAMVEGTGTGTGTGKIGSRDQRMRNFFLRGSETRIVDNTPEGTADVSAYYRFALTRDPVKRFISMYSNRVVHHRELSRKAKCAERIRTQGLSFDPQINDLVERLQDYIRVAKSINHHSRPQSEFIGPDLSVYTRIADISALPDVAAEIRDHWQRESLEDVCRQAPEAPGRKQTGGPKLGLNVLSPASFEALLEFYREDYARIPTLSLDAIRREYAAARASGEAAPVEFPPLRKPAAVTGPKGKSGPAAKAGPAGKAGTAGKSGKTLAGDKRVRVKIEPSSRAELVRVNPPARAAPGAGIVLKGAVVLKSGQAGECRLLAESGGELCAVDWGLESPGLARRFADNPHARSARFRLEGGRLDSGTAVKIFLEADGRDRELLATVYL